MPYKEGVTEHIHSLNKNFFAINVSSSELLSNLSIYLSCSLTLSINQSSIYLSIYLSISFSLSLYIYTFFCISVDKETRYEMISCS